MLAAALLMASAGVLVDPAAAAVAAQYQCVVEQVSSADRHAFRMAPGRVLSERVGTYAASCGERFGWNESQRRSACDFALAVIARDHLRARLLAERIDVAVIDHWAELYDDWSDAMDNEDAARLHSDLRRAGIPVERINRYTSEIGQYLAARETIAAIRDGRLSRRSFP